MDRSWKLNRDNMRREGESSASVARRRSSLDDLPPAHGEGEQPEWAGLGNAGIGSVRGGTVWWLPASVCGRHVACDESDLGPCCSRLLVSTAFCFRHLS